MSQIKLGHRFYTDGWFRCFYFSVCWLQRIITLSGQLPRMPITNWRVPISWVIYDAKDGNGVKWHKIFVMMTTVTQNDNWPVSQGHQDSARQSASACPGCPRTAAGIWCWRCRGPPWPWRRPTRRPQVSAWRCRQGSDDRPQVRTGISPDGDRESVNVVQKLVPLPLINN